MRVFPLALGIMTGLALSSAAHARDQIFPQQL